MKSILSFLYRSFISLIILVIIGPIAYFGFNLSFWVSALLAILGGGITNFILKSRQQKRLLKENELTKKEFQYINSNLKEAKLKISRLNKAILGIRSFRAGKLLGGLQKMVKQIYQIVKKEPKRFYQAERFFFYHLDSVVELSERYVFLTRQNVKDSDVRLSLTETEQTLEKLAKSLDDDLLMVLSNDIETLNLELDVAKQNHEVDNQSLGGYSQSISEQKDVRHDDSEPFLLNDKEQPIQINFTDQVNRKKELVPDERR